MVNDDTTCDTCGAPAYKRYDGDWGCFNGHIQVEPYRSIEYVEAVPTDLGESVEGFNRYSNQFREWATPMEMTDWYDLPSDMRDRISRAAIAGTPKELTSGKEPDTPEIQLADAADMVDRTEKIHEYNSHMALVMATPAFAGVALSVVGAFISQRLFWLGIVLFVVGIAATAAWMANHDPKDSYELAVSARESFSRKQRRLPE